MADGSGVSSDDDGGDEEEIMLYECRQCRGKFFNADERDVHRQWHRDQKAAKNKAGRSRSSVPDGVDSEATTLFVATTGRAEGGGTGGQGQQKKRKKISIKKPSKPPKTPAATASKPGTSSSGRKIIPIHHFDASVQKEQTNGA